MKNEVEPLSAKSARSIKSVNSVKANETLMDEDNNEDLLNYVNKLNVL